MIGTKATIDTVYFYPGMRYGLSSKTAIVKISQIDESMFEKESDQNFDQHMVELAPVDNFYISIAREWKKSFLVQDNEKSSLAHRVAALTMAIQLWSRVPVGKGRVLGSTKDSIVLALAWDRENIFRQALFFALNYILLWSDQTKHRLKLDELTQRYNQWLSQIQKKTLTPNTLRFALAAIQKNIPIIREYDQIKLGYGKNAIRLNSSFTDNTSSVASVLAKNKMKTNILLRQALVPVPLSLFSSTQQEALKAAKAISYPLVVKPLDQEQGKGITTNISNRESLIQALVKAKKLSPQGVIIEKHIIGNDYRMLIVKGILIAVARRIPGGVTGDGKKTIKQLLTILNSDPRRGDDKQSPMKRILLDEEADKLMRTEGLTPDDIPQKDQFVRLRQTANISSGGTAEDASKHVHPDNRFVAERAAQIIGLDIAGVDFLSPDISRSWREVGGAVIEVNAQPGFRPHWLCMPDQDINTEVLDHLLRNRPMRIPTAAITGTNGKTTTAKMLHHIWLISGKNAGVCTTNGLWIGENIISDDNLSGNPGGNILLNDPTVEAAIIEMPRKGLIVFGHPCDRYDVAALLNIQNDHIGVDGINTSEEMATLKSEVLFRSKNAVVINAEDALCMKVARGINSRKLILVSKDNNVPLFEEHIQRGGSAVSTRVIDSVQWIMLTTERKENRLIAVNDIPAVMGGAAAFNTSNAMFAAGLAWAQNLTLNAIRTGLSTFTSSAAQNPGRMNFIDGFPFKLLLDFSHNPDTVKNLTQLVKQIHVRGKKRVLLQTIGNRHRSHFKESAADLVDTFDEFIISCNHGLVIKNPEWNSGDPVGMMIEAGKESLTQKGAPKECIHLERDPKKAISDSLKNTEAGDLLVLLTSYNTAMPIIASLIS